MTDEELKVNDKRMFTADGELLVISSAHLYCLAVATEEPARDR